MRRTCLPILVSLFLLGAAACSDEGDPSDTDVGAEEQEDGGDGGEGGDGARDDYVVELADEMEADPEFPLDREQATCFAETIVDEIGVDALEEAGVEPADLASGGEDRATRELIEEHRDEIATGLAGCDLSAALGPMLESELGASAESLACVLDSIDEEEFADLLVGAALGEEDSESGEAYGRALVGNLDGPCAKRLMIDTLVSQQVIAEDQRACFEEQLEERLAQRLLDSEAQQNEAAQLQEELGVVIAACA